MARLYVDSQLLRTVFFQEWFGKPVFLYWFYYACLKIRKGQWTIWLVVLVWFFPIVLCTECLFTNGTKDENIASHQDYLESCTMAHMKDAEKLFLCTSPFDFLPIFCISALSWTFYMKSPTPQICHRDSPFSKEQGIWFIKHSATMNATQLCQAFVVQFLDRAKHI